MQSLDLKVELSSIKFDYRTVGVVTSEITCDQAFFLFFFFQGRTRRERHKGIIGREHDLRLRRKLQGVPKVHIIPLLHKSVMQYDWSG